MKKILKHIVVSVLTALAWLVLCRYRPRIVAITGSVGKTSTKDVVTAVFSHYYSVRKSEKSLNSETGVPLSILGCSSGWGNPMRWLAVFARGLWLIVWPHRYPTWLVLEVGADKPDDIYKLARWLAPDIMIGTRMSETPVHVEFFDSPEDVVREKRYLAEAVREDGVLVLNYDDPDIHGFKEKVSRRAITYGLNEHADIRGTNMKIVYEDEKPQGITFKIEDGRHTVPVTVYGTIGNHVVYTTLAGIAAGVAHGFNLVEMSGVFESFTPPPGRMRIIAGIKDTIIIDDSYNSSPVAVENALGTLQDVTCSAKKIVVLGDMLELGSYSKRAHSEAGERAARACDQLITVGLRSRWIAAAAREAGMDERDVIECYDAQSAGKELELRIETGDIALIKGSQGSGKDTIRLERAVEEVMAEPERAQELLVRQEDEWKKR